MFYKFEEQRLNETNAVMFPDGNFLALDSKDEHTYPVDGWYYFATEEEAKTFFNVPYPVLVIV